MRLGVADARAGTPRARFRRTSTSREAPRAPRRVSRSAVRETSDGGAVEDDALASSSRRSPSPPSGDRLQASDDASLFARLEAVTARVFDAVSPDIDALVPERRPPALSRMVRVVGSVPEIDWAEATKTEARFRDLTRTFAGYEGHVREPVILRGAADAWPCVRDPAKRWTLSNLTKNHGAFAGETRVRRRGAAEKMGLAASEFQYVEANHPAVRSGVFQSPSTIKEMTIAEVAARMTTESSERDESSDGVYMQAELFGELAREAGLTNDEPRVEDDDDDSSPEFSKSFWALCDDAGWRETQPPRLWLSQAGSTSSLHYDSSVSVLAQAHGLKRMLLYPPSALARAALYPDWHPLRRRSAVRLDAGFDEDGSARRAFPRWAGEEERFEDEDEDANENENERFAGVGADARAAAGHLGGLNASKPNRATHAGVDSTRSTIFTSPPGAWEAVLGPGDVLVFPPRWAHYTESLGPRASASVTRRFAARDVDTPTNLETWRALHASSSDDDDTDTDAMNKETAARAARRFARWRVRAGGPSAGARALEQLERAGVVRATSRKSLRVDTETGAVLPEDTALAFARNNENDAVLFGGRGGAARHADRWTEAARDAARVATAACEGWDVSDSFLDGSRENDALDRIGLGRVAGVYARGSVARREARPGVSDVDLVVLCWDDGETKTTTLRAATREAFAGDDCVWRTKWSHVRATKVDVRIALVPLPPHPAGVALANLLDADDNTEASSSSDTTKTRRAALATWLGPELAFVLSTESVTLAGADVPSALPERSRVPPLRCLPTLRRDVVEALADGGERSLRWALRRTLRAAFEKEALGGVCDETVATSDGTEKDERKKPSGTKKKKTFERSEYTRDLFRCAVFVARNRPELGEDLACALVAAVHGPRAVWGALWYAGGSALAQRLADEVAAFEV